MLLDIIYNISIITASLLLLLLTIILIYYKHAFTYWKKKGVLYLQPTFPFGNTGPKITKFAGQIVAELYHKLKKTGAKFGGCYMLTTPVFIPLDPQLYKQVLMKDFQYFQDHGIYVNETYDPMAVSILTLDGDKWKYMRNKITPAFSPKRLKIMFPLIQECTKGLNEILEDIANTAESFDVYEIAARFNADVIGSCAFGIECNCLKNPDSEFRKYGKMIFSQNIINILRLRLAMSLPILCKLFKIHLFDPKCEEFFQNVVKETVEYREKNNIHRDDIMDLLIRLKNNENISDNVNVVNDQKGININQIAAQNLLFYLAGFETSSNTSAYCMFELAQNSDIVENIRKEFKSVLLKHGELTYDALMEMKYLDQVVSETLRKYTPVLMLDRKCTKDYRIPETDIVIEKGTTMLISTYGIHRDQEFYPDPEKFDPERFSDEEKAKRPPYTYMPYGDGPRICPGLSLAPLQVKSFILALLKNYNFTIDPKMVLPLETYSFGNLSNALTKILLQVEKI